MRKTYLLWLSGSLALLLFLAMVVFTLPLRPGIPCLQLTYSEAAFKAILVQWGPHGMARFRTHFAIDFPVLASYGLFGYLLGSWSSLFTAQAATLRRLIIWMLPTAAGMDAAENLFHLYLISGAPEIPEALYLAAGSIASIKWLLIVIFVTSTAYCWIKSRLSCPH
jgi:hypothetical protein